MAGVNTTRISAAGVALVDGFDRARNAGRITSIGGGRNGHLLLASH